MKTTITRTGIPEPGRRSLVLRSAKVVTLRLLGAVMMSLLLLMGRPSHAGDDAARSVLFERMRTMLDTKRADRMQVIELSAELAKTPRQSIAFLEEKSRSPDVLTQRTAVVAALLFYPIANTPALLNAPEAEALNRFVDKEARTMAWAVTHPEARASSDLLLALPPGKSRTPR